MSQSAKLDIDRLIELSAAGAERAADAFAQLVGERVVAADPVACSEPAVTAGDASADPASTGVFFAFEGCLDALVGILFPGAANDSLVRHIVGLEHGELEAPIVESALMEVGNILASHVASAIADRLASRLLPSIPTLAMSHADAAFAIFVERSVGGETQHIESKLLDERGEVVGRLVMVPAR